MGRVDPTIRWACVCALMVVSVASTAHAEDLQDADALIAAGAEAVTRGALDEAERHYLRALRENNAQWEVHLAVGDFLFRERLSCARALVHYDVVLEKAPPQIREHLGEVYSSVLQCLEGQGEWERARHVANGWYTTLKGVKRHREARIALRRRGVNELRAKLYEEAEVTLHDVLMDDYEDALAHMNRAHARFFLGQYQRALEGYTYVKEQLGAPMVDLYIGITQSRLERHREALQAFEVSLKLDGEFPRTWHWIALAYEGIEDKTRAEEAYRRCLELAPNNPKVASEVRNNLAWLIVQRSGPSAPDLVEALALARGAVEASRGQIATYTDTLAVVYLKLGALDDALRWSQTSLRLNPSSAYYQRQLEQIQDHALRFGTPGGRLRLDASDP